MSYLFQGINRFWTNNDINEQPAKEKNKMSSMWLYRIAILLIPIIGYAQQPSWLCIGEYAAGVTEKDGKATGSASGTNDQKYLVDGRGVRRFGNDYVFLDKCNFSEGRPGMCEHSKGFGGLFLYDGSTFKLIEIFFGGADGEIQELSIVIGTCSSLSE